ncbi:MAG: GEVED domain-containing protein [Bacteroidia bacterium]|nr:GEVED domain-containing protein [Bacteroidia bacterium]MDW8346200.1 GEVED domain-containing protein [Bacteroidia bacterium]
MKKIKSSLLILLLLIGMQSYYAQYCIPTYSSLCSSGDYINNFSFNTIVNNSSGCNGNPNNYIFYSALSTVVNPGNSYSISMQSGPAWGQGFGVWIDYNIDGDFSDPGEFVYSSPGSGTGVFSGMVTIPSWATTGSTRLRVRCAYATVPTATDICTNFFYGETEDYVVIINAPTPMVYNNAETIQITDIVTRGTTHAPVIGIKINTTGSLSPFNLTKIKLNTLGTTSVSDIANAKLWYTGNTPTFSATTQFGSTIAAPSGVMYFTGSQVLTGGPNYFWLTYDVLPTATMGNVIDATCDSLYISAAPFGAVPSPTAPTGSRLIDYCVSGSTTTGGFWEAYISGVQLGTTTLSSGTPNNKYIFYPTPVAPIEINVNTPITINTAFVNWGINYNVGVWIDYNKDGNFAPTEQVFTGSGTSGTPITGNILLPTSASTGNTRMRVVYAYAYGTMPTPLPCGTYDEGETEDYTVNIQPYTNLKAISILAPASTIAFVGYNNPVTVRFSNIGDVAITNPTLSLKSSTAPLVSEVYSGTINPGQTIDYTFTGYYVPTALGPDQLLVWVKGAGDNTPTDDTVKKNLIIKRADLKAEALLSPVPTVVLENDLVTVKFVVRNLSNEALSGFTLRYKVGSAPAVSATYSGTLAANDSIHFTFPTPYLASTVGILPFKIWTDLSADQDRTNDTISTTLRVDRIDMKMAMIINPTASMVPGASVPVKVAIVNVGTRAVNNPQLCYKLNTNAPVVEVATPLGTINPGDSIIYTYTTTLNIGTGPFSLKTYINTPNDVRKFNDTLVLNGNASTSSILIDARAESIVIPTFVTAGTPTNLTIKIRNLGLTAISNVQVSFRESPSGSPVVENFTGTIAPGGSANYTFTASYTPSSNTPTICIRTINPNGNPDANPSNDSTCVQFAPNSLQEGLFGQGNIQIYPNPVLDNLNISLNITESMDINMALIDLKGNTAWQQVYRYGAGTYTENIPVSHLPAGIYLLKLTNGTNIYTHRVMISKE